MEESKINNLVDNVYVLNLEKDLFKYEIAKGILDKKNIRHQRFIGVDGYDGPIGTKEKVQGFKNVLDEYEKETDFYESLIRRAGSILAAVGPHGGVGSGALRTRGSMGCLLSHKKIIQDAIDNKYKKILILQDDIYFHNQFEKILNDLEPTIKSSTMVHLGATEFNRFVINSKWPDPSWSYERVRYSTTEETCGLFAVIVDEEMFEPVMRLMSFNFFPADICFSLVAFNLFFHSSWVAYPNLIISDLTYSRTSSIEKRGFKMKSRNMSKGCAAKFGWFLDHYDLNERYHAGVHGKYAN